LGELAFVDQRKRFLAVVVGPRALEPCALLGTKLMLCSKHRSLGGGRSEHVAHAIILARSVDPRHDFLLDDARGFYDRINLGQRTLTITNKQFLSQKLLRVIQRYIRGLSARKNQVKLR